MKILVAYDVSTVDVAGPKRLRTVARACEDYGVRVQKSIFECTVGATDWVKLRGRLMAAIEPKKDSLRFYYLAADTVVEHHGPGKPTDLDSLLVV